MDSWCKGWVYGLDFLSVFIPFSRTVDIGMRVMGATGCGRVSSRCWHGEGFRRDEIRERGCDRDR